MIVAPAVRPVRLGAVVVAGRCVGLLVRVAPVVAGLTGRLVALVVAVTAMRGVVVTFAVAL